MANKLKELLSGGGKEGGLFNFGRKRENPGDDGVAELPSRIRIRKVGENWRLINPSEGVPIHQDDLVILTKVLNFAEHGETWLHFVYDIILNEKSRVIALTIGEPNRDNPVPPLPFLEKLTVRYSIYYSGSKTTEGWLGQHRFNLLRNITIRPNGVTGLVTFPEELAPNLKELDIAYMGRTRYSTFSLDLRTLDPNMVIKWYAGLRFDDTQFDLLARHCHGEENNDTEQRRCTVGRLCEMGYVAFLNGLLVGNEALAWTQEEIKQHTPWYGSMRHMLCGFIDDKLQPLESPEPKPESKSEFEPKATAKFPLLQSMLGRLLGRNNIRNR